VQRQLQTHHAPISAHQWHGEGSGSGPEAGSCAIAGAWIRRAPARRRWSCWRTPSLQSQSCHRRSRRGGRAGWPRWSRRGTSITTVGTTTTSRRGGGALRARRPVRWGLHTMMLHPSSGGCMEILRRAACPLHYSICFDVLSHEESSRAFALFLCSVSPISCGCLQCSSQGSESSTGALDCLRGWQILFLCSAMPCHGMRTNCKKARFRRCAPGPAYCLISSACAQRSCVNAGAGGDCAGRGLRFPIFWAREGGAAALPPQYGVRGR
jgi:hypothetical protein